MGILLLGWNIWWWVRVLPPPGTLIWRLPGFIRPRCTAGATHRFAESYERVALHGSNITESIKPRLTPLSSMWISRLPRCVTFQERLRQKVEPAHMGWASHYIE